MQVRTYKIWTSRKVPEISIKDKNILNPLITVDIKCTLSYNKSEFTDICVKYWQLCHVAKFNVTYVKPCNAYDLVSTPLFTGMVSLFSLPVSAIYI